MWNFIKLLFWIVVIIILFYHWQTFIDFIGAMIDWIVYGMKSISTGPPTPQELPGGFESVSPVCVYSIKFLIITKKVL